MKRISRRAFLRAVPFGLGIAGALGCNAVWDDPDPDEVEIAGVPRFPDPAPLPGYPMAACGFADTAGRRGYVANDEGGIDAVDLATGDLVWQTREACQPIVLAHKGLFALGQPARHLGQVVVFSCQRKGEVLLRSDPFPVLEAEKISKPAQVDLTGCGRIEGHALHLSWSASSRTPADGRFTQLYSRGGSATIDLSSGHADLTTAQDRFLSVPAPLVVKVAADLRGAFTRPYLAPMGGMCLPKLGGVVADPKEGGLVGDGECWVAGDLAFALLGEPHHKHGSLRLGRWDRASGRSLGVIVLKREGCSTRCFNGRHLLYSTCLHLVFAAAEKRPVPVKVFSVEEGRWVANVELEKSALTPVSAGPRVFYMTEGPPTGPPGLRRIGRLLKAVDFDSGQVLWEREIRGRFVD
jgi:hypothetical protein